MKMASNLDYPLEDETSRERRGLYEPASPIERDLELLARHTLFDFRESTDVSIGNLNNIFPLTIYYARRNGDSTNISVRMKTSHNKPIYSSDYIPVFRAVSLAHKLHTLFRRNHYGCDITREIVEDG